LQFFEGHDWFIGKATSYEEPYYHVLYEDGDREECAEKDLSDILLTHDLAKVTVGSQVAVHWPDDDDYYEATVVTDQNWSKTPIELECDSGHFKWVGLRKASFAC
jgi:formylmethanofuran dehydrogenase subunit A